MHSSENLLVTEVDTVEGSDSCHCRSIGASGEVLNTVHKRGAQFSTLT